MRIKPGYPCLRVPGLRTAITDKFILLTLLVHTNINHSDPPKSFSGSCVGKSRIRPAVQIRLAVAGCLWTGIPQGIKPSVDKRTIPDIAADGQDASAVGIQQRTLAGPFSPDHDPSVIRVSLLKTSRGSRGAPAFSGSSRSSDETPGFHPGRRGILTKMSLSETRRYSEAPKYHGIPCGDWDFNPVNSPANVNGAGVNGSPGPPHVATEATGPRRYVGEINTEKP